MAVHLELNIEGRIFRSTVDQENNWTVDLASEEDARQEAALLADLAATIVEHGGYILEPENAFAMAIVGEFPESRILGGRYPVPRLRRPPVTY